MNDETWMTLSEILQRAWRPISERLKQLVKDGYVTSMTVDNLTLYAITEEGKQRLKARRAELRRRKRDFPTFLPMAVCR